ncbi:MAG: hypothetical protein OHK0056_17810 [Bacteriovoracaceae bacterium]
MKKILISFIILFTALKFCSALVPLDAVDPLNYHLVISKYLVHGLWNEAWTTIPGSLMSGLFDFIYLIPHLVFDYGMASQISSQILHLFFGLYLGSYLVFKNLRFRNEVFALMAALSILSIARSYNFFFMAKNDGALATVYLWTLIQLRKKNHILLAIGMGLLPAIKMNGLLYVAPVFIFFAFENRNLWREVFKVSIISFIVFLPILMRNTYYMGNPLFPGLIKHIPGKATAEMIQYYSEFMSNPISFKTLYLNVWHLFTGKLLFLAAPIFSFINFLDMNTNEMFRFYLLCFRFVYILQLMEVSSLIVFSSLPIL